MVRPGGLELPTFWFVAVRPILPNLARGVANRTDSASWGNSVQSAFSFFFRSLRRNCWYFPHLALRFRDSCHSGPFRRFTTTSNASIRTRSRARSITASAFLLASTTHLMPFSLDLLDACDAKLPFERRRRKNKINRPREASTNLAHCASTLSNLPSKGSNVARHPFGDRLLSFWLPETIH